MTNTIDTTSGAGVIPFLRTLRQVRRFRPEPIPDDVLSDILDVARWTGSAKNVQPWELLLVRDPDTLRWLAATGQYTGFLDGAPLAIVLVMDGYSASTEAYDEGRLTERIMLAAKAHGVGSGTAWFGSKEASARVRERLGIPDEKTVRSAVGLGYPADDALTSSGRGGRKPLADIVHHERYGAND
jgi:nitroreductase